jgi:hypothetical protein
MHARASKLKEELPTRVWKGSWQTKCAHTSKRVLSARERQGKGQGHDRPCSHPSFPQNLEGARRGAKDAREADARASHEWTPRTRHHESECRTRRGSCPSQNQTRYGKPDGEQQIVGSRMPSHGDRHLGMAVQRELKGTTKRDRTGAQSHRAATTHLGSKEGRGEKANRACKHAEASPQRPDHGTRTRGWKPVVGRVRVNV